MSNFEEVSEQRAQLTELAERGARLSSLMSHPSWKEFIDDGLLKDDILSLVASKSDPHLQDEKIQRNIDNSLLGLSILRRKLAAILNEGREAKYLLDGDEDVSYDEGDND